MNVSRQYFEKTVQTIRRKCAVVLCADTKYTIEDTNRRNNEQKKQRIACCLANAESIEQFEQSVLEFESIGKASEFLNIDKSNISKVLKGKLKQTNGCTFKYVE